MFGLGAGELFIIFLIVLLLFGAKRIPEIVKGMGKGIRLFRKEVKEGEEETNITQDQ